MRSLHAEIFVPERICLRYVAVGAAALAALAAGIALQPARIAPPAQIATLALTHTDEISAATTTVREAPAPQASPSDIMFVFRAGRRTFMQLPPVELEIHRQGRVTLVDNDGVKSAVVKLDATRMPAEHRSWLGSRVVVDDSCEAEVVGFAQIGRLVGQPDYAGIHDADWTAATVLARGANVIAAELSGCDGTYARQAGQRPVVRLRELDDGALTARARTLLLASKAAAAAQQQWDELGQTGTWSRAADISITNRALYHEATDTTWVWAQARVDEGCGGFNANLFGLFRVAADGSLEPVVLRELGDMSTIDAIVDTEGDGSLELLGEGFFGLDRLITRANGDVITRLKLEFYGCAC